MLFTTGFLSLVLLTWINSRFVVAAVRRQLMIAWATTVVEAVRSAEVDYSKAMSLLESLVPHEMTLSAFLRTVWSTCLAPTISARDTLVAQFDGYYSCRRTWLGKRVDRPSRGYVVCSQVIRHDATFQVQKKAVVKVGRRNVRVSSCVLTITGE